MKFSWRGVLAANALLFSFIVAPVFAKPNHVVLGYSGYWFDDIYPPEAYNYDGLTHIARSFLVPLSDGHIPVPTKFFDPALTQGAKAHGVKLIASLGGGAAGPDAWYSITKNPDNRKRLFDELEKLIGDNGYDGVDVDWEPGASNKDQEAVFTTFLKALRTRFPKWTITTALGAGKDAAEFTDWKELSSVVDYFNLMAYDYAGGWGTNSAHPANLFPSDEVKRNSGYSTDQSVSVLLGQYQVNPAQLLVGLPFYGRQFFTPDLGDPFVNGLPKAAARHYYEIAPLLKDKNFKLQWDEAAQAPFLVKNWGRGVVAYDGARTIARKCRYVVDKNLAGVIIWNLGADVEGSKATLLDTVALSFGSHGKVFPTKALSRMVSTFEEMALGAWDSLSRLKARLEAVGKTAEAGMAEPGPAPRLSDALPSSEKELSERLIRLQKRLGELEQKTSDGWKTAATLSHYERPGVKPVFKGDRFLVDDFEKDSKRWAGPVGWSAEADHYRLGTEAHFEPVTAGCPDSRGAAGRFFGHLGQGRQPYPRALLKFDLTTTKGGKANPADLSDFKGIEFWAKGDGGVYHVTLGQEELGGGAYYGADFTVGKDWQKFTFLFSKFKSYGGVSPYSWENNFSNPGGGGAVPLSFFLYDVKFFSFGPVNATGDVDFDLTVDQVQLIKS